MKIIYMFVVYSLFNINSVLTMELIPLKTNDKIDIKKEYIQCLPQDVQLVIVKKVCWLRWHTEITRLEKYMPITIGNKELSSIDLWKISTENRIKILEQSKKEFYTMKDHSELTSLLSPEQKQGLMINRLPLDDEVYQDYCGVPGGKKYLAYLIAPGLSVPFSIIGGAMLYAAGSPIGIVIGIPAGVVGLLTIGGSIGVYYYYKTTAETNSVPMTFEEV